MLVNTAKEAVLNHLCGRTGNVDLLDGTGIFVGLSTVEPNSDDGSGFKEPTASEYNRVLLGNPTQDLTLKMNAADNGQIVNGETIFFPEATSTWQDDLANGDFGYFLIFGSEAATECIGYGQINAGTPIQVTDGKVPLLRPGQLIWQIT